MCSVDITHFAYCLFTRVQRPVCIPEDLPFDSERKSGDLALNLGRCLTVKDMHRVLSIAISITVVIWVAIGGKLSGVHVLVLQQTALVSVLASSRCI